MGKVNFRALPPVEVTTETKSFTDPKQPGVEVAFTLMDRSGPLERFDLVARGRELKEEFITGKLDDRGNLLKDKDGDPVLQARPVIINHGIGKPKEIVPVNETLIGLVVLLEGMQADGNERYGAEDLIIFSRRMPGAFAEACMWVHDFLKRTSPDYAKEVEDKDNPLSESSDEQTESSTSELPLNVPESMPGSQSTLLLEYEASTEVLELSAVP